MNYKTLVNSIVGCCMLSGAALMAYVDIKKRDMAIDTMVEVHEDKRLKHAQQPCSGNK